MVTMSWIWRRMLSWTALNSLPLLLRYLMTTGMRYKCPKYSVTSYSSCILYEIHSHLSTFTVHLTT
jgi:hypothetical protein